MRSTFVIFLAAILVVGISAGCIEDAAKIGSVGGEVGQKSVQNVKGAFVWSGQCASYSNVEEYLWECTSAAPYVYISGQFGSGRLAILIWDANGTETYNRTFSGAQQASQAEPTRNGTSGTWKIVLDFENCTGQLSVQVVTDNAYFQSQYGPGSVSQKNVQNMPNSFAWGGQCAAYTANEEYTWTCTGLKAYVTVAGQFGGGSLTLSICSSDGKEIYNQTFSGAGQTTNGGSTDTGFPGDWKIYLDFKQCVGQVSLSITLSV
jgi:hypothetical protein